MSAAVGYAKDLHVAAPFVDDGCAVAEARGLVGAEVKFESEGVAHCLVVWRCVNQLLILAACRSERAQFRIVN
jgi:hypothetical protein